MCTLFPTDVVYTLDPAPPPLSLAQRMGLVDAPHGLLNEYSWEKVKRSSNQRHDSSLPCPICQEGFQLSTQVGIIDPQLTEDQCTEFLPGGGGGGGGGGGELRHEKKRRGGGGGGGGGGRKLNNVRLRNVKGQ